MGSIANQITNSITTHITVTNLFFKRYKGEKLGILLDKSDALHNQMNQIFIKQGLTTPDLSLLSPVDKEEWNRLYEQSKVLSDEICKLING